jgi:uncharacterized membrane protein YvbJ
MICLSCGTDNDNRSRFCGHCGRKLQSRFVMAERSQAQGASQAGGLLLSFGSLSWRRIRHHLEAWLVVLLLLGAVVVSGRTQDPLALYVAVPLAGLVALLRKY